MYPYVITFFTGSLIIWIIPKVHITDPTVMATGSNSCNIFSPYGFVSSELEGLESFFLLN